METKIKISRDWENDGILRWKDAQTLDLYNELEEQLGQKPKGFEDEIFFAFSEEQFREGMAKIPADAKGLEIFRFTGGGFGTERAIKALSEHEDAIYKRIETECDPQEVYYYEFNNFESFISWDGDSEAIRKVMYYFGDDVARTIKRKRAFYTIDEIKERANS